MIQSFHDQKACVFIFNEARRKRKSETMLECTTSISDVSVAPISTACEYNALRSYHRNTL